MVALAYLEGIEGPLWTSVRGTGLAYGVSFSHSAESGHLFFDVYRSPNAFAAFSASKATIEDYANGKAEIEALGFEGAISSIVLGFANRQASMASAAQWSFVRQVIRELPSNWTETVMKKVREVEVGEVKKVIKEFLLPIFESETTNLVVTCAPIMQEVGSSFSSSTSPRSRPPALPPSQIPHPPIPCGVIVR